MFVFAPLPSWKNLLSIFFFRNVDRAFLSKTWTEPSNVSLWFSKSAWSLFSIATWKKFHSDPNQEITFWFPEYFCNSSLFLLREQGVKFVFYPIKENREPDYAVCKELATKHPLDAFVLVHYFGKPNDANRAFEFCKTKNAVLIEDAAHILKPVKGIGEKGDFVLYSPHKHLPIPDGAVLIVRNSGPSNVVWEKGDEDRVKRSAQEFYRANGNTRFLLLKWTLKRLLQKLGFRSRIDPHSDFLNDVSTEIVSFPFLSSLSGKMLSDIVLRLGAVAKKKIRIREIWNAILSDRFGLNVNPESMDRNWTPYLAEYSFDRTEEAESAFRALLQDGIPVSTWPDLPPEVLKNNENGIANGQRRTRLFVSIHQSLSESKIANLYYGEKKSLPIASEELNAESWNEELNRIEHANLLQSWEYGEAKRIGEGWKAKRILLRSSGKKIGLVQILFKSYLKVFNVFRINRGPLFYQDVSELEKEASLRFLSGYASIKRGSVLFFNPELNLNGRSLISLYRNGFVKRNQVSWSSSYVDLSLDRESLRKILDGKWRNMLNAAEKNELSLEVSVSPDDFRWMLEKYSELMQTKEFSGIAVPFLQKMRDCSSDVEKPLLLIASHSGRRIACVCLTLSNRTAMYLVGWNGEEGRRLKANQFLLWNAIVELKDRGYRWFDLGGIDEENTSAIAEFKLGINGARYELAGEFLAF
ncbi:GNAT family N-acetyltransferase [Leptospira barantonii]|uniref:GNAT family N-acetyltransferase n=1 Tax=Leptospira barantonii TaxID=2023184 RepID=A0A5F2B0X3_9LEPT|nr:GNAT family N-acetyltransferase [Leptospira barantonii]TGL98143.1 GNAT family N-acetyltransferase [Leptospira barantonii]